MKSQKLLIVEVSPTGDIYLWVDNAADENLLNEFTPVVFFADRHIGISYDCPKDVAAIEGGVISVSGSQAASVWKQHTRAVKRNDVTVDGVMTVIETHVAMVRDQWDNVREHEKPRLRINVEIVPPPKIS